MALSNRDRIGRMLEVLAPALDDFISAAIGTDDPALGADWVSLIRDKDVRNGAPATKQYDPLDPQVQLRMLTEANLTTARKPRWYPFDASLGRLGQSYAAELIPARNTFAHNGSFTDDDALRVLDTAERLLQLIGDVEATAKVRANRLDLRRRTAEKDDRRTLKSAASDNPASVGLRPWREVLPPHQDVASGNFHASEFAADLYKVAAGDVDLGRDYTDPVEFFNRTYLTEGLRDLLGRGVRRLTGDPNASPVINLQTNFGGGKTHSMLSLWHLAGRVPQGQFPQDLQELLGEHGYADTVGRVRRVAIVGNHFSTNGDLKPDGTTVNTVWGEIAWQLGGREAYELVRVADEKRTPPGAGLHALLAAYSPALILIDEWVAYARTLVGRDDLAGGTFDDQFTFAQSLTEAVKAAPGVLLAISIPASESGGLHSDPAPGSAEEVGGANGLEALKRLQNVVRRVADQWRPASSVEAYHIVRRRLFIEPGGVALADINRTARFFVELYRQHQDDFPRESRDTAYEDRIKQTFPIHPELFDRLYEDWSGLERFQRTRGVLRLMNTVIHALWIGDDASPLIMPGSIPLAASEVNTELTQYLQDHWKAVIDADVDGPNSEPHRIDKDKPLFGQRHLTKRLARTVFFGAAPTIGAAQKGLETKRVFLGTAMPGDTPGNFHSALTQLGDRATYFYSGQGKYWYDLQANISRRAKDQAERLHAEDVWQEIAIRLRRTDTRSGDFARVHPCPEETGDIPDTDEARLVLLHPRFVHKRTATASDALEFARKALENKGSAHRTYRNMLVFLAPDAERMAELDTAARDYLAWTDVLGSADLDLTQNQRNQAEERRRTANQTVDLRLSGTYLWAISPVQPDASRPFKLKATKVDASDSHSPAERVSKRLGNDGDLSTRQSAAPIRLALNKVPKIWSGGHVALGDLWQLYASYPYMPRLRDQSVVLNGVLDQPMIWNLDGFALADGHEDERYVNLRFGPGRLPGVASGATLVVRPDVAEQQFERERRQQEERQQASAGTNTPAVRVGPASAPAPVSGEGRIDIEHPREPMAMVNHRYFGVKTLDPQRYTLDFKSISDEVLAHLSASGIRLTVKVEIEAISDPGFNTAQTRTISENATVLKFDDSGFERE